jgi:hypothetical protein
MLLPQSPEPLKPTSPPLDQGETMGWRLTAESLHEFKNRGCALNFGTERTQPVKMLQQSLQDEAVVATLPVPSHVMPVHKTLADSPRAFFNEWFIALITAGRGDLAVA